MQYADLIFYKAKFHGTKIPDDNFDYYAGIATDYIIANFDYSSAETEKLSKACCAVAEVYYSEESQNSISSEKVGDYSVTYQTDSRQLKTKLYETASRYL